MTNEEPEPTVDATATFRYEVKIGLDEDRFEALEQIANDMDPGEPPPPTVEDAARVLVFAGIDNWRNHR